MGRRAALGGELRRVLSVVPPGTLYHYTSQRALIEIVKKCVLWATEIRFLNDAKEFVLAVDVAGRELGKAGPRCADAHERELLADIARLIEHPHQWGSYVCVASFSAQGDLLSQWRAYSPSSSGCAIGFASAGLVAAARDQGFRLVPCVYDEATQGRLVAEAIDGTLRDFRRDVAAGGNVYERREWHAAQFAGRLLWLAPMLKHPTFREDEEWRLVSDPTPHTHKRVSYREGKSRILPYYELELAKDHETLPIACIMIGPTPDFDLAHTSVMGFLVRWTGQSHIAHSKIPYRDW